MDVTERLTAYFAARDARAVDAVYLFGSQAEDRAHAESDIDIAILLTWNELPDRLDRTLECERHAAQLLAELGRDRVDVVCLNDAPPLFARAIIRRGRVLFCRDAEAVHAFVRDTQLRAADLEPFVQRGRRRLLEWLGA